MEETKIFGGDHFFFTKKISFEKWISISFFFWKNSVVVGDANHLFVLKNHVLVKTDVSFAWHEYPRGKRTESPLFSISFHGGHIILLAD